MYKVNLNSQRGIDSVKAMAKKWADGSAIQIPLIIIKISEAFSMYHQVSRADVIINNQSWTKLHPVLVNDLDTHENVLLIMDTNGVIVHFYLIDNQGKLQVADRLKKVAAKTTEQEYLDYFYCIAKNVENAVQRERSHHYTDRRRD